MLFNSNQSAEKRLFIHSLLFPLLMAFVMFTIKLVEQLENTSFASWGVNPRQLSSLSGILFTPLLHGDWTHLLSNLPSFVVLSVLLLYFYRGLAYRTFFIIYLFTGAFIWIFGRESYHVGASGVIYGLAAFLLFSGVIRNHIPLMAITLVVIFLYGSMIWGIFPFKVDLPYSWEAHLGGTIIGLFLAIIFRNRGPQRVVKIWEEEDDGGDEYWKNTQQTSDEEKLNHSIKNYNKGHELLYNSYRACASISNAIYNASALQTCLPTRQARMMHKSYFLVFSNLFCYINVGHHY